MPQGVAVAVGPLDPVAGVGAEMLERKAEWSASPWQQHVRAIRGESVLPSAAGRLLQLDSSTAPAREAACSIQQGNTM